MSSAFVPYFIFSMYFQKKKHYFFAAKQRIAKEKIEELNALLQVNTCIYIFMCKYLYFSEL